MTRLIRIRWLSALSWWKQVLVLFMSYVILTFFGVLFVSPTAPGYGRELYVILLVYSCLLIFLNSKVARVFGLVVGIFALVGVILTTMEKVDFSRQMQRKIEQKRLESLKRIEPANE